MYRLYYCIVLLSKRSCGVIYHLFILGGPYRQHLWKTMGKIHDTVQWKVISRILRSSRIRVTRNLCLFWSTFLLSSVLQYWVKPSAIDHLFGLWWPCSRHFRSPWKLSIWIWWQFNNPSHKRGHAVDTFSWPWPWILNRLRIRFTVYNIL